MIQPEFQITPIALAAPTTTLVFSGKGLLHTITINKPVAAGVITVYDALTATGTPIAIITRAGTLLSDAPVSLLYDAAISTGLCIVTSGAAQDISVTWQK